MRMGGSHTAYVHSQERSAGRLLECNVGDRQTSARSCRLRVVQGTVSCGNEYLSEFRASDLIASSCDMPYTRFHNGGGFG